ncbi:hypothetical protein AMD24_00100 [Candidatus Xiphinematobacter sp. Idaho Grape]|nr:hypothetical protein AMD24_00100 [Candidatus Xiphinematobacter sp. Idaho Grape]
MCLIGCIEESNTNPRLYCFQRLMRFSASVLLLGNRCTTLHTETFQDFKSICVQTCFS